MIAGNQSPGDYSSESLILFGSSDAGARDSVLIGLPLAADGNHGSISYPFQLLLFNLFH